MVLDRKQISFTKKEITYESWLKIMAAIVFSSCPYNGFLS